MDKIQEAQGWTNDTMLELLKDFIASAALTEEACAYLERIAENENKE